MRVSPSSLAAAIAAAFSALVLTSVAEAKCTKLGFSVNDYGKDGPTKDAKSLLDTYIAKWTGENGIKKYTTGTKTVNCELFLNFIVFDEHTCKAEATVCWADSDAPAAAASVPAAVNAGAAAAPKPAAAVAKSAAPVAAKPAAAKPAAPAAAPAEEKK